MNAEMLPVLREAIQQAIEECYDAESLYYLWRVAVELIGDPVDYAPRS